MGASGYVKVGVGVWGRELQCTNTVEIIKLSKFRIRSTDQPRGNREFLHILFPLTSQIFRMIRIISSDKTDNL